MAVKTYSIKKNGLNYKISEHFTLSEMACKDGSDAVLVAEELMKKLEKLRSYGNFTITINSGYRTVAYNKKIGGATGSLHTKGYAADIIVRKDGEIVNGKLVCCLAQSLGFGGIGYISTNAVHVDARLSGSYRGDERKGYGNNVSDFYKYFGISKAKIEALKAEEKPKEEVKPVEKPVVNPNVKVDNNPDAWAKEAIQFAIKNNILKGDENGNYKLRSDCTRQEMLVFLHRYYQYIK